ncbi:hypothetical protein GCM10009535_00030 [Streptomyces thermocarboxydovorans]|uniref:Uncharacterized protein n=1 Tax=Streptomyces thermocarboxydovorans TaxID=59298 RepID=A0ABN1H4K5_9ACTN
MAIPPSPPALRRKGRAHCAQYGTETCQTGGRTQEFKGARPWHGHERRQGPPCRGGPSAAVQEEAPMGGAVVLALVTALRRVSPIPQSSSGDSQRMCRSTGATRKQT